MDRFIANKGYLHILRERYLKSNMDRFIVMLTVKIDEDKVHLKSNMDRFIVAALRQLCIEQDI